MADELTGRQPQRPDGPETMAERQEARDPALHNPRDVRQGEIILKKPWQKTVFVAGLVGIVLIIAITGVLAWS